MLKWPELASLPDLRQWIGRTETAEDVIGASQLHRLAALLDYDGMPWTVAPPLAHWLFFLPTAKQSELDGDGHPRRGDFWPPIDLPRRMWVGGRLTFHEPLHTGAVAVRVSAIKDVVFKTGASGELAFVTVGHEVLLDGRVAITEEQDFVYRAPVSAEAKPNPVRDEPVSATEEGFAPDTRALFRFSALTYNAHRIHYDRNYATETEGYPGLVVHGPLIATSLLHHFLRRHPNVVVARFSFRARQPLFAGEAAALCSNGQGELWCRNEAGAVTMSASVEGS